jgi:glutamate---cysteine ligase / carboxylate-amine ligase
MTLHWFEAFGIELEYMIVDRQSLAVKPIADQVLSRLAQLPLAVCAEDAGEPPMEVELGPVAWSNELALHVIELKTNGPAPELGAVSAHFAAAVTTLNRVLADFDARLMPSAMHPRMQPDREFRLWPRDDEGIYGTFDRIFDCRGHGWSNLQSMHVNLPFASDDEFAPLHAAVRFLLPLLPALSASSPLLEGRVTEHLDERLHTYRGNAKRVPSVSGHVVPESVRTRADYEGHLLAGIYRDLAPLDPEGALQHEWVNARGAIARFDRMALEIRVIDAQECPRADLALAWVVTEVLRSKAFSRAFDAVDPQWSAERLAAILTQTIQHADAAVVSDREFLDLWGIHSQRPLSAREIWAELLEQIEPERRVPAFWADAQLFVAQGPLARRILRRMGVDDAGQLNSALEPSHVDRVYAELCECLHSNRRFEA